VTRVNHKDEYYRDYFNKKYCARIELVAAIERTTKKQAAELLINAGLSSYVGKKLTEYIENERAARELKPKSKSHPVRPGRLSTGVSSRST
jgi:hypothetical protein